MLLLGFGLYIWARCRRPPCGDFLLMVALVRNDTRFPDRWGAFSLNLGRC